MQTKCICVNKSPYERNENEYFKDLQISKNVRNWRRNSRSIYPVSLEFVKYA